MTCLSEYNSTILIDGFFIDATLGGANPYGDVKSGAQITIQGYLTTAKLRLERNSNDNDCDKPLFPRDCGLRAPDDVAIVGASLARVAGNAGLYSAEGFTESGQATQGDEFETEVVSNSEDKDEYDEFEKSETEPKDSVDHDVDDDASKHEGDRGTVDDENDGDADRDGVLNEDEDKDEDESDRGGGKKSKNDFDPWSDGEPIESFSEQSCDSSISGQDFEMDRSIGKCDKPASYEAESSPEPPEAKSRYSFFPNIELIDFGGLLWHYRLDVRRMLSSSVVDSVTDIPSDHMLTPFKSTMRA